MLKAIFGKSALLSLYQVFPYILDKALITIIFLHYFIKFYVCSLSRNLFCMLHIGIYLEYQYRVYNYQKKLFGLFLLRKDYEIFNNLYVKVNFCIFFARGSSVYS